MTALARAVLVWGLRGRGDPRPLEADGAPDPPSGTAAPLAEPGMTQAQRASFLRRIDESDTYLPAMLETGDSMIIRWPERIDDPLRVFVETGSVPGYNERSRRAVLDAFRRWERVPEIPVDFVYTRSPDGADVIVKWVETFPVERAGQADMIWRSDGLLQSGTLTLATHAYQSHRALSTDAIFTVALHEIGHLLGLGHSDRARDVMAPTTRVHDLTSRDRRTAMLLYNLAPGKIGR